jgi:hypothetical protein
MTNTINDFGKFEFGLSVEVPGAIGGVASMEFDQDEEKALQAYTELVALHQRGLLPGLDNITLKKYYQPPKGEDLVPLRDCTKIYQAGEQVAPPPPVREKEGLKGELDLTTLEHFFFYFYYAINFLGEAEALHHINSVTPEEIFGYHLAVS